MTFNSFVLAGALMLSTAMPVISSDSSGEKRGRDNDHIAQDDETTKRRSTRKNKGTSIIETEGSEVDDDGAFDPYSSLSQLTKITPKKRNRKVKAVAPVASVAEDVAALPEKRARSVSPLADAISPFLVRIVSKEFEEGVLQEAEDQQNQAVDQSDVAQLLMQLNIPEAGPADAPILKAVEPNLPMLTKQARIELIARANNGDQNAQNEIVQRFTQGRFSIGNFERVDMEKWKSTLELAESTDQHAFFVLILVNSGKMTDWNIIDYCPSVKKNILKRAEQGDPAANCNLAHMHLSGILCVKNAAESQRLFTIAAAADPRAQRDLGFILYNKAIRQNDAGIMGQAAELYKKAADQGFVLAKYELAMMHFNGQAGLNNHALGFQLMEEAALNGVPAAQSFRGEMFQEGRGVNKDPVEALKWFQLAADNNDPQAQVKMGEHCFRDASDLHRFEKAYAWFKKAMDQKHTRAQALMAKLLLSQEATRIGKFDLNTAMNLYRTAAQAGDTIAMVNLGSILIHGKHTVSKNLEEGFKLFKKAAELGEYAGKMWLAICYASGYGCEANDQMATELLLPLAQKNDKSAIDLLLKIYTKNGEHAKLLSLLMGSKELPRELLKQVSLAQEQRNAPVMAITNLTQLKTFAGQWLYNVELNSPAVQQVMNSMRPLLSGLELIADRLKNSPILGTFFTAKPELVASIPQGKAPSNVHYVEYQGLKLLTLGPINAPAAKAVMTFFERPMAGEGYQNEKEFSDLSTYLCAGTQLACALRLQTQGETQETQKLCALLQQNFDLMRKPAMRTLTTLFQANDFMKLMMKHDLEAIQTLRAQRKGAEMQTTLLAQPMENNVVLKSLQMAEDYLVNRSALTRKMHDEFAQVAANLHKQLLDVSGRNEAIKNSHQHIMPLIGAPDVVPVAPAAKAKFDIDLLGDE